MDIIKAYRLTNAQPKTRLLYLLEPYILKHSQSFDPNQLMQLTQYFI